jgi:hypothetical protein
MESWMIDYEKLGRLYGEELESYLNGLVKYWEDKVQETKELIAKNKLTKPEPKYKIGDEVFFINYPFINMEIVSGIVESFKAYNDYLGYVIKHSQYSTCRKESFLFPTRQALIEHQIAYWTSLKVDEISASRTCPQCGMQCVADGMCWNMKCGYKEPQVDVDVCQHESNQSSLIIRCDGDIDNPFECIKCGEFYR